jgi:hypothetical protein
MPRVVISYRRSDSAAIAGRIADQLKARFGEDSVFIIPFGVDYRDHIERELLKSESLIVVIGPRWLAPDSDGTRRIHNEADPVRVEIETALREQVPVIPVLVDNAAMPTVKDLPDSLNGFAFLNAAEVDIGRDFRHHVDRLGQALDKLANRTSTDATASSETSAETPVAAAGLAKTAVKLSAISRRPRARTSRTGWSLSNRNLELRLCSRPVEGPPGATLGLCKAAVGALAGRRRGSRRHPAGHPPGRLQACHGCRNRCAAPAECAHAGADGLIQGMDDIVEVLTGDARSWEARAKSLPTVATAVIPSARPPTTYRVLPKVAGGVQNLRAGPSIAYDIVVAIPEGSTGIRSAIVVRRKTARPRGPGALPTGAAIRAGYRAAASSMRRPAYHRRARTTAA